MKKIKILSVCFIALFVSCSKNESIKNVSFKGSLVYFENELLTGTVYENYSNGSIFKSYNIEDGIILDQTHFSKKGDTLATMYYNEDGSYNRYTDKTLKNNNINFGCSVISKDGSSKCIGSNNIPDANFRIARLYDFWIKSNNLTEAYGSSSPTYPKGGATIGRARGESSMSLTGITAKDWFQLQAGNLLKPKGPYTSDKIFVSIKYSTDGFNEENFNEEASLSWNIDEQTNANEIFSPSNIIMKANYSPKDGSSSGAMFSAYLGEEGNYYVMNVTGSNNNFIYSAKMEFPSEKDLKIANDIFTGYTIIDPPGYDFNKFELYLNGDKKQGSVLSIRRNHNSKLNNNLENQNSNSQNKEKLKSFTIKKYPDIPSWFDNVERTYMLNDDRTLGPEEYPEIIGGYISNKGEIFFIDNKEVIFTEKQIKINKKGSIIEKILKSEQYTIKITSDSELTTGAYSEGKIDLYIDNISVFNSPLIISGF